MLMDTLCKWCWWILSVTHPPVETKRKSDRNNCVKDLLYDLSVCMYLFISGTFKSHLVSLNRSKAREIQHLVLFQ